MCFSASASFTASAGLLIIGAIALNQSRSTPQRVLASIPIFFSIQQFNEGLLWLSLTNVEYLNWRIMSMYMFLVFAQLVWPVLVPFTMLLFEKEPLRKNILRFLLGTGILTSLYLTYCIFFYNVEAIVKDHHIKYELNFPYANRWVSGIGYTLATVISPLVSSLNQLKILGWILLASYFASRIFYQQYLISVWCYFAAILSLSILIIIRQLNVDLNKS